MQMVTTKENKAQLSYEFCFFYSEKGAEIDTYPRAARTAVWGQQAVLLVR